MNKKKNTGDKKIILLILATFISGMLVGVFLTKRVYHSRTEFCYKMAQSYLQDFIAKESKNNTDWEMGIDIETDMYNLCSLDLDKQSLKDFKSYVINKYKND